MAPALIVGAASAVPAPAAAPRAAGVRLRWAFAFAVVAFAWLRFSDNRADNDLWGHVLYGERMLALGRLERTDVLSWTAAGAPWINHEVGAELVLGLVHRAAGGHGLWAFMVVMAALTVGGAFREGTRSRARVWTTLAVLAASTNFIALGYAVRPQLFTLLGFVALLFGLQRFISGRLRWGAALPPLFALWVNFHGGYLAGWLVLVVAIAADAFFNRWHFTARSRTGNGLGVSLLLVVGCTAALALNPDGVRLVAWTVQSVQLPRPAITEWQPLPWSFAAAPFFVVLGATALAWFFSLRRRQLWQLVVLAFLAAAALLQQRHAPLFGLANLIFTPQHLESALRRGAPLALNLVRLFHRGLVQALAAAALVLAGGAAVLASVRAPREHPFTIEVPREIYPVAAIGFMRAHALTGRTLTFFDWGQQVLWELPDNPVSFDGRLDTVYPRPLMDAHWRLYRGEPPGAALDVTQASVALLPTDAGGVDLLRHAGWHLVYRDPLAAVLVRERGAFPQLASRERPALAGPAAVAGRVPFPDTPPALAGPARPR